MRYYETMFIIRQDAPAASIDTIADSFQEIITSDGGEMTRRENWGLKNLAYIINKNKKAHFVLFNYKANASTVDELERKLGISSDVLRYMTTKTDSAVTGESVEMKKSSK